MIEKPTVEFLYSQDLSNYKTDKDKASVDAWFLYSQDLSNYKTKQESRQ